MVSVWCVYVGIWFFKQRTAFEMRISYLSSDVCSADLHLPPGYIRRCIHLRCRRRAATLCPGLHRIGKRCLSQGDYPMTHAAQIKVPATYMRGGTSKGVFFRLQDLPAAAQAPGAARDALLMRVIGSPDPYGKQTDGMGGATSSTSKTVILSKSDRPGHDVNYLFGQVSIDKPFIDWQNRKGLG